MYRNNPAAHLKRIIKALTTNQIARLAPSLYIKLTRQTGRGSEEESVEQIASYFNNCFAEYFELIPADTNNIESYLAGKNVLEYGPGDVPAVAVLMIAHGAERVTCVDRFPMLSLSEKNTTVLYHLINSLPDEKKKRAESCFKIAGDPSSGFDADRITYLVHPRGLSGLKEKADLIISRAVLEHVNDLNETFADMRNALLPEGVAVHLVDLRSHGLHMVNPLDFLTWPEMLYAMMYSQKGVPNRLRIDSYREAIKKNGLKQILMKPVLSADPKDINEVRPHLAKPFYHISDDDLMCLSFWLVLSRD